MLSNQADQPSAQAERSVRRRLMIVHSLLAPGVRRQKKKRQKSLIQIQDPAACSTSFVPVDRVGRCSAQGSRRAYGVARS